MGEDTTPDGVTAEIVERHDREFRNVWDSLEAQRKETAAQSQNIGILTGDVRAIAQSVNKMTDSIKELTTRLGNVERPNLSLWLQVAMFVFVTGGALWVTAIRPVQMSIEDTNDEVRTLRGDVQGIQQTRWTRSDHDASIEDNREQRDLILNNERLLVDMRFRHERELGELRQSYLEKELDQQAKRLDGLVDRGAQAPVP